MKKATRAQLLKTIVELQHKIDKQNTTLYLMVNYLTNPDIPPSLKITRALETYVESQTTIKKEA